MESLKIVFALLSVTAGVLAFALYFRGIFLKNTKPHIFTWFIWLITQGIATAGILHGGGGLGAVELVIGTTLIFFVFLFSLKKGTTDIAKSDYLVLFASLVAVFIWLQLDSPLGAVLMVSAIDAFGYIPSFRKSWREPWSEQLLTWTLFTVGNFFSLLALSEYNLLTLVYLITISIGNLALIGICLFRRGKSA
jgi:hypothetical protein